MERLTEHDLHSFCWMREPSQWALRPDGVLSITAPPRTDFFCNPDGSAPVANVPFLYRSMTGDFVARACVRPAFISTYDAGALMVYANQDLWAKLCFEATDFGTHAVVSVITNGLSDDANGPDVSVEQVWLQVVRVGNLFAMHYALDGSTWHMLRYFGLPMPNDIQVGVLAQSPVGPGTTAEFSSVSIENRRIQNLRAGI